MVGAGFDYASKHENNVRAMAFFEALLVPLPSLDQWPNQTAAQAFRLCRTPQVGWDLIANENNFVEKRLPIAGEPADVAATQMHDPAWLQKTEVPKLLIFAHPGALTPEPIVAWAKANLPKLQSVDIGDGIHNLQEDHLRKSARRS